MECLTCVGNIEVAKFACYRFTVHPIGRRRHFAIRGKRRQITVVFAAVASIVIHSDVTNKVFE